jgi:hypothetical protein
MDFADKVSSGLAVYKMCTPKMVSAYTPFGGLLNARIVTKDIPNNETIEREFSADNFQSQ